MRTNLYTIKDLYSEFLNKSKYENQKFLSYPDFEWWQESYGVNTTKYDRMFSRLYSSFVYYADDYEKNIDDIIDEMREDFEMWLTANAEKYRQLFRVLSVPDAQNELFENVNGTETTTVTFGKKTEYTHAEKKDTHDTANDAYTDTQTQSNDAFSDITTDEKGKTHGKTDHSVAPYDSDTAHLESADDTTQDAYTDKSTLAGGARHGVNTNDFGKTHGVITDTFGAHTDSDADSGTEVTEYKRHGNIGVTTVSGMLKQHVNFWDSMEFLTRIFADFARYFLIVG